MTRRISKSPSGVRLVPATRVLLVEDDPLIARALTRQLWTPDYRLKLVTCCAEALEAGVEFDVGVFDVNLPDGSGLALAAELLEEGTVERVVFFSDEQDPALVGRATQLGTYVSKQQGMHVLAVVLRATVESLLARRGSQAG